jgi:tryptophan synthase alpha chain
MNRIDRCFVKLKERGDKALVCFLTSGDPDFATTAELVNEIVRCGADIVELGVPFSDPLADGPSIQASSFRALQAGATVRGVLDNVREIRALLRQAQDAQVVRQAQGAQAAKDAPIVLMTYFNPLQKYGLERFAADAAEAGADGVILTDLPPEEAADWKTAANKAGLASIFLLAPTSTKERIELAAKMGSGFIYCVSRTGVTGARSDMPAELRALVERIKAASDLPVLVGFGISKPEHVSFVTQFADGAVVGSALVNVIADHAGSADMVQSAGQFVRDLKTGIARRE